MPIIHSVAEDVVEDVMSRPLPPSSFVVNVVFVRLRLLVSKKARVPCPSFIHSFMPLVEEAEDEWEEDRGKEGERSMVGEPFYRWL